jgi:hypothetical protein
MHNQFKEIMIFSQEIYLEALNPLLLPQISWATYLEELQSNSKQLIYLEAHLPPRQ